jgi:AcrR family transcriptional regulator
MYIMQTQGHGKGQARGEATRNDILQVARQLFSEHGYHTTGIADIQSATGLTKGAFYHHFSSKEDVALAVLERVQADYHERLFAAAMERATARERVIAALDRGLTLNQSPDWCNCRMMATLCTEMTSADERLRETILAMHRGMYDFWVELLEGCEREGDLREGMRPSYGAQLIVSALMGMMTARKLGNEAFDLGAIVATLKHSLFGGVGIT